VIYNLNFNYGKVAVTGVEKEYAAVITISGNMAHLPFKGSIDIADTNNGYLTSFFGCSGYRVSDDHSWIFCNGFLVCYVENNTCFAVTDNNNPIDCTPSHTLYKRLTGLIELGDALPPNNVFRLR
jgi:hypothetical protein